jgi:hypothetical protein
MQLPTQEDIRQEPFETKNVYLFTQKNSFEGIVSPVPATSACLIQKNNIH